MKRLLSIATLLLFAVLLVSCKDSETSRYTVTFETAGGSTVEAKEVEDGSLVERPTDPTREGFIFKGWFTDEAKTIAWKWGVDKVVANTTLYAKWEQKEVVVDPTEFTVTFNFNYSGAAAPVSVVVEEGKKATAPEVPARVDFEFVGWSTSRTEYAAFDLNAPVTGDVTVYAFWRSTKVEHTVTVDLGYDNITETHGVLDGELLEIANPIRGGFIFGGWLLNGEAFDLQTPITSNITIVANWFQDVGLEGTAITTAAELVELFTTGGEGVYYLATDIDMAGVEYQGSLGSGEAAVVFSGTLNGNGKRIKNLNVTTASNKSAAMFGILNAATIKDLIIMRSSVTVPGEGAGFISTYAYAGTTFENITFINVSTNSTGNYAGLLFADNSGSVGDVPVTIKNIAIVNDADHVISANRYAGALVGYMRVDQILNISNIYIKSVIEIPTNSTAGALVARINNEGAVVNVDGVYFEGKSIATNYVGGLVGEANVEATINLSNVAISDTTVSGGSSVGLLVARRHANLNLTTTNIVYANSQVLSKGVAQEIPAAEASETVLDQAWFDASQLDKTFFGFANGKVTHLVDLGPKTAETLTISKSSYNNLFVKGVDTTLDLSGLEVSVAFSDGSTSLLAAGEYQIDQSAFNPEATGTYTILVEYEGLKGEVLIDVVEIVDLSVYTYDIASLFLVDQVDVTKIVVHANLGDGTTLLLDNADLTVVYDAAAVGVQNVTVTFKDTYTAKFPITVVETGLTAVDGQVKVVVDQALVEASGTVVDGVVHVKTVKEAINLIEKSGLLVTDVKLIEVKNGTYFEKIRIATPNVILKGESQAGTIIDHNQASGTLKPLGGAWGTQGSATVTISSAAKGIIVTNLTISNSFDYYNATFNDKQAVAMVNEADQALFYKVSFKGLQDTLYAKNGRQWYLEVYVEGIVDYIFGNGGPAFFENSVIHTLRRQNSDETVITANQGLGSDGTKLIKYGYVFYNNKLTAGEGTPIGTVDLGRPWRQNSAVAFIDNQFGTFVTERGWRDWDSSILAANANYYEFGNMIGETLYQSTGGKQLTAEEAVLYRDKAVVFAPINGEVTFEGEWDYLASLQKVAPELFATVTFDVDGVLTDEIVLKGNAVAEPTAPFKSGYTFDGWLLGTELYNFATLVNADITLVAKFTLIEGPKVTVTYKDGETILNIVEVPQGEVTTQPLDPDKEGFDFVEWRLDGVAYDFAAPVTTNIILVAHFVEAAEPYVPVGTPIATVEEFYTFATANNSGDWYLANDLDFNGYNWVWVASKNFSGVLDGNFKTISNLTIVSSANRAGIWHSFRGEMKNITFVNANISSTESARAGLIAGEFTNNPITLTNITVDGLTVAGADNNGVGGLAGYANQPVTATNITIKNANISSYNRAVGGLFGRVGDGNSGWDVSVTNVYMENVSISGPERVGALFGESNGAEVEEINHIIVNVDNVVAIGIEIVSTGAYAGGLVGKYNPAGGLLGTATNVFFEGTINGTSHGLVAVDKKFETVTNYWYKGATAAGTGQNTENVLAPEFTQNQDWWDTNLAVFSINDAWVYDEVLNVYKLK